MIYELLRKANAKALIHEFDLGSMLTNSPIPTHVAIDARTADLQGAPLPPMVQPASGSDTIMIFHTSGSTSGSPKLIRCSYTWLGSIIEKAGLTGKSIRPMGHDVTVWMGSVCHIGQTSMLLGSLQSAACTIQPTQIAFSSDELLDMITRCGLNRLNQFPAFLGIHMRNSRQNPKLLAQLCALDETSIPGSRCPARTKSGRPSPPVRSKYQIRFFPLVPREQPAEGYADANSQLLELVILSDSPDCPDPSLRQADGHYHTGDLFVEVALGAYDNARAACGALIADCIVVGNARPSPVLFVEPGVAMDEERLKREIIRKTRHFHARRYLHERITSPRMVVVVPSGTLPRTATKGNIRRRAVEEAFKAELDQIFAA
ncbi:hypothetical protein A0H81_12333 [Grifola frondosa]|uniref:AMP-dependent synthetase/ligase domain-containing protein n=1 Tax=Grifola frondosa TaxID=5627 RepID=A0A1C7LXM3_GRIFR|nr:hypothetical protein A0H81_12333 [Grifola frondosa]